MCAPQIWGLLMLGIYSAAPGMAESPALEPGDGKRALTVQSVAEDTGAPLAGAKFEASVGDDKARGVTDAEGKVTVYAPEDGDYVSVTVNAPGYVPLQFSWVETRKLPFEKEVTLRHPKGVLIGGTVVDEAGAPVEGATVELLGLTPNELEGPISPDCSQRVKTDAQGKWTFDQMHEQIQEVWLKFSHPHYIRDDMFGMTSNISIQELRKQTGKSVLKKGVLLAGRVLDPDGNPVEHAEVMLGSDRNGSDFPSTGTREDGSFKLRNRPAGQEVITVVKDGFAPQLVEVTCEPDMAPLEIRLEPAHVFRAKVVDTEGKPLASIPITADTWRGHRSLDWHGETDAEGRVQWASAPADVVLYDLYPSGYMTLRNEAAVAGEEEHVFTLHPPLTIVGKVLDKDTGEPLDKFDVVPALRWEGQKTPYFQRDNVQNGSAGAFEFELTHPYPNMSVRIEAEGYAPATSREFQAKDGRIELAFEMEKREVQAGRVVDAAGLPVANARVLFLGPGAHVSMVDGNWQAHDKQEAHTGILGDFTMPHMDEPWTIVASADAGYAEVLDTEWSNGGDVILKPWAKVEGVARTGNQPAANLELVMYQPRIYQEERANISFQVKAITDSEGRFKMEGLAPGEWNLSRAIKVGNSTHYSHALPMTIAPGEAKKIEFGGGGRSVVAMLAPPEDNTDLRYEFGDYSLSFRPAQPEVPEGLGLEEKRKWYEEWQKSEEGIAFRLAQRNYTLAPEKNGTIHGVDIPAGTYTLNVRVHEPPKGNQCGYGEVKATYNSETVTIPAAETGKEEESYDLGKLVLTMVKRLKVGDAVPAVAVKNLKGEPLQLADFKGKYVLLEFWATWCGPCHAEIPHLKNAFEKFGTREDFAMVSLSLDQEAETAKKFVEEKGMAWNHGFLGEWSSTKVPEEFGVQGIPAVFLIDPDGKLLRTGMRGEEIVRQVELALAEKVAKN